LSLEQYHLLLELDDLALTLNEDGNPPTIGQVAEVLNNAQNTVSERVSRLEKKGLVERVPDKSDKRVSRVTITERGRKLLKALNFLAGDEFLYSSLAKLDDSVLDQLLPGLELLASTLRGEG